MGAGYSKESFAALVSVHKQTIYNWIDEHEEFLDAVKIGEAKCRLYWERLGMSGANGSDEFNATTWIFNMKNRFHEEWRDRHEHTGAGGGPIKTESKVLQVVPVKPGETDADSGS